MKISFINIIGRVLHRCMENKAYNVKKEYLAGVIMLAKFLT